MQLQGAVSAPLKRLYTKSQEDFPRSLDEGKQLCDSLLSHFVGQGCQHVLLPFCFMHLSLL